MPVMELILSICIASIPSLLLYIFWCFYSGRWCFHIFFALGIILFAYALAFLGYSLWQEGFEISSRKLAIALSSLIWITGPLMLIFPNTSISKRTMFLLCVIIPVPAANVFYFLF